MFIMSILLFGVITIPSIVSAVFLALVGDEESKKAIPSIIGIIIITGVYAPIAVYVGLADILKFEPIFSMFTRRMVILPSFLLITLGLLIFYPIVITRKNYN